MSTKASQTLQGSTAAAGSLIPTAWEVNLPSRRGCEAAKQQVTDYCRHSKRNVCAEAQRTWRCSGKDGCNSMTLHRMV